MHSPRGSSVNVLLIFHTGQHFTLQLEILKTFFIAIRDINFPEFGVFVIDPLKKCDCLPKISFLSADIDLSFRISTSKALWNGSPWTRQKRVIGPVIDSFCLVLRSFSRSVRLHGWEGRFTLYDESYLLSTCIYVLELLNSPGLT